MNAFVYDNVSTMYRDIVSKLVSQKSPNGTKELTNVLLHIKDVTDHVITDRDISLSYLCGELLWYMTGSNDVNFISKFAKKWSEITDDGETSNSAYGHILKYRHGFDQVKTIIDLLKQDKNTRRAVINFNVPNPNVITTKDEICTVALQFLMRDDELHCTAIMRSNDVYTGMPYDIAFFVSLQKIIAHELNIKCGTYAHFVTSLHLYNSVEEKLLLALQKKNISVKLNAVNLLTLTEEDYESIYHSSSPKLDVIKLFTKKKIVEVNISED